jgi:citrate lyase subunit beta/citryl-CoA lyase
MSTIQFIRTALFVPGNRSERVDKAVRTDADMIIMDLEDAVAMGEKPKARRTVHNKIEQHAERMLMVRINAIETGLADEDLKEIVVPGLDAVMLPKVDDPRNIQHVDAKITVLEHERGIDKGSVKVIGLVETALGVEHAFRIASTTTQTQRLFTLAFGAADYSLDMGIEMSRAERALYFARARLALACRAAGIAPALDTPFMIDLKDLVAFKADVEYGKTLGFGGKLCIHPNQIEICNRLYSPSRNEVDKAQKIVSAFEAAEEQGLAAIQVDGKFIDYPVVAQARRTLEMAATIASTGKEA